MPKLQFDLRLLLGMITAVAVGFACWRVQAVAVLPLLPILVIHFTQAFGARSLAVLSLLFFLVAMPFPFVTYHHAFSSHSILVLSVMVQAAFSLIWIGGPQSLNGIAAIVSLDLANLFFILGTACFWLWQNRSNALFKSMSSQRLAVFFGIGCMAPFWCVGNDLSLGIGYGYWLASMLTMFVASSRRLMEIKDEEDSRS